MGDLGRFGGRGRRLLVALLAAPALVAGCGVAAHQSSPPLDRAAVAPAQPGAVPVADRPPDPNDGVVDVVTQLGGNARGAGTGIVLTPDGTVLTNNHVIEDARSIQVTDVTDGRSYPASVQGYDTGHDVAVLRVDGARGLPTARLGDSSRIGPDDPVMAVGNAGGRGGPPARTTGRVTGMNQAITAGGSDDAERLDGLLRGSARLEQGDSGGPLLDAAGRVVGMNTATSADPRTGRVGGTGYAIPINEVRRISDQILAGRPEPGLHLGGTGQLGVSVVAPEVLSSAGSEQLGAAVVDVARGSGAERAGLAPGDVIVAVDGKPVPTPDELTRAVREHRPGETVRLTWTGAGGQRSGQAVLGAGPPA